MNKTNRLKGMRLLVAAAMMGMALPAGAQSSNGYIIYYGGFLTHDATTGAVVTGRTTTFDLSTCLWTITENYIRPVSNDGSTTPDPASEPTNRPSKNARCVVLIERYPALLYTKSLTGRR